MKIDIATATIIAAIAAFVGAIVGAGITFLNTWLTRRSEQRRQIRELAVRAAIEEWKSHAELAEKHRRTTHPLDLYLIHAMYFVQTLDGSLKTQEEICNHLRKVHNITDAANQEIENYSKKQHKENASQPVTPADAQKRG